jgi:hypothetical protein
VKPISAKIASDGILPPAARASIRTSWLVTTIANSTENTAAA